MKSEIEIHVGSYCYLICCIIEMGSSATADILEYAIGEDKNVRQPGYYLLKPVIVDQRCSSWMEGPSSFGSQQRRIGWRPEIGDRGVE